MLLLRLEFLDIGGVNSGLRIDVVGLALISIIPVLRTASIYTLSLVFSMIFLTIIQICIFELSITRAIVGNLLYISIICFSEYRKFITRDDLVYICKWFLLINSILHLSDIFISLGVDHNFTGRYGVFNQHFAFSSAILIAYSYLVIEKQTTKAHTVLFYSAFLLSGSRGLIAGYIFDYL